MIVSPVEDRRPDITDQVFEEAADHHVYYLAYLQRYFRPKTCFSMKLNELLTTGYVLLSTSLIQFVKSRVGKFFLVDGRTEVERHIIHQE